MKQLSTSQLLIAAVLTVLTDAQVSLETVDTLQNSFICGEQQILKCIINPYSNIMTWTKDTYPDPLASCTPSTCAVNPSMSASYNFTFDIVNGIFYMEILTVKVADNGTSYSCANGFVSATVTSNVNVEDKCTIVKDNKTIDSDTTEVSATTGCMQDNALESVKFDWSFQEVNKNGSEKIKIELESVTNYENSTCTSDPDCGVSGYSYVINSINITNDDTGKDYRISVDVICGDSTINFVYNDIIFTKNYTESTIPPPSITTDTQAQPSAKNTIIIVVSVIGGLVLLVILIFSFRKLCKKRKE